MTESNGFVALKGAHLRIIVDAEPKYAYLKEFTEGTRGDAWEKHPVAFAYIYNGAPVAAIGLAEYWPGRAEAWALFTKAAGPAMLAIHRGVSAFLANLDTRRIELAVEVDFERGHRWARLLGFKLDALFLESYFTDGKSASLYSRVI